jgi:putative phosphoesterase
MRVVIFSDIHGNAVALAAVLDHIRREAAPDAIVVAGDLVVDGPRPAEALALLRDLKGALFVMGNTDQDVLHQSGDIFEFTRSKLHADDLEWLGSLPFSQQITAAPGHDLLVVHVNPRNLRDALKPDLSPVLVRPLLEGVQQEVIAFGHFHVPYIRHLDNHVLVDVASVGLPRDGVLRAVYVTLTFDGRNWQVAHHRIAFDVEAVARDYEAVGYPGAQKQAKKFLKASY